MAGHQLGRHRLRAPCVVCHRVLLPYGGHVCYSCLQRMDVPRFGRPEPDRFDRDDDDGGPVPRYCRICGSVIVGSACAACGPARPAANDGMLAG